MGLSRRNTLIGIGTVAAGAGVVGASGAFTSVEADRSVSISSTNDTDANVQIEADPEDKHDAISGGSGDTLDLSFSGLNQNAITDFDDAVGITPNSGSAGSYDVTVDLVDGDNNPISWVTVSVSNGTSITNGTTADVDIEIDLTNNQASSFPSDAVLSISVSQA